MVLNHLNMMLNHLNMVLNQQNMMLNLPNMVLIHPNMMLNHPNMMLNLPNMMLNLPNMMYCSEYCICSNKSVASQHKSFISCSCWPHFPAGLIARVGVTSHPPPPPPRRHHAPCTPSTTALSCPPAPTSVLQLSCCNAQ